MSKQETQWRCLSEKKQKVGDIKIQLPCSSAVAQTVEGSLEDVEGERQVACIWALNHVEKRGGG